MYTFHGGSLQGPWLKSDPVSCYGTEHRTHCSSLPETNMMKSNKYQQSYVKLISHQ